MFAELKQAVDAWSRAADADKAARFAAAEAIRWLEWGVRSYQSFMLGLALLLFGAVIALTARISPPIGYLMGLSGVAYIVQGWVIGVSGFSAANMPATLTGILLVLTTVTSRGGLSGEREAGRTHQPRTAGIRGGDDRRRRGAGQGAPGNGLMDRRRKRRAFVEKTSTEDQTVWAPQARKDHRGSTEGAPRLFDDRPRRGMSSRCRLEDVTGALHARAPRDPPSGGNGLQTTPLPAATEIAVRDERRVTEFARRTGCAVV